jgi:hypothetical protein
VVWGPLRSPWGVVLALAREVNVTPVETLGWGTDLAPEGNVTPVGILAVALGRGTDLAPEVPLTPVGPLAVAQWGVLARHRRVT